MSPSVVELRCAAPVAVLWRTLTDLSATTAVVPLTSASADDSPVAVGWSFTARTGIGPVGFDDLMVVTRFSPPATAAATPVSATPSAAAPASTPADPAESTQDRSAPDSGHLRIIKLGRLLDGWALIEVRSEGPSASRLRWSEEVGPRPLALAWMGRLPPARGMTEALVRQMAADLVTRAEAAQRQAVADRGPSSGPRG